MERIVRMRVKSRWALFTRPELRPERITYDAPTPAVVRFSFQAIHWKPEFQYIPKRIYVVRRGYKLAQMLNEVRWRGRLPASKEMRADTVRPGIFLDGRQGCLTTRVQRGCLYLRDVEYVFAAAIRAPAEQEILKHEAILQRRLQKGQYAKLPCLGTAECVCDCLPVAPGETIRTENWSEDLGWMHGDFAYAAPRGPCERTPLSFQARIIDGVIELPDLAGGRP